MIETIEKILKYAKNTSQTSQLLVVYLNEQLDLESNGWFDEDPAWQEICQAYEKLNEELQNALSDVE